METIGSLILKFSNTHNQPLFFKISKNTLMMMHTRV